MFCMLCLNETQVGLKVFSDEGNYLQVDKTIRKHFWIVPIEHDEYSNTVCYSCWGLVHSFNDFYKKVEEAHQKHQKTPTKKNVVPIITKIETQTFQHNEQYEDQMEDSNFMEDDFDDPLNPNPSVSVSEEYEPEVIPAKRKRSSTSYKENSDVVHKRIDITDTDSENGTRRLEDDSVSTRSSHQNIHDHRLYQTLLEIDPENIHYMYNRCKICKVKHSQLRYLTPLHINLLIPSSEIGIMAEFTFKLDAWKNSAKVMEIAQKVAEAQANVMENLNKAPVVGNPHSLLNIISANRGLYLKAINSPEPGQPPKTLNARECSVMMDLIKNNFINNANCRMTYDDMERLSEEIVQYFPGEEKFTYFKKEMRIMKDNSTRFRPTGKLPNKWNNRKERDQKRDQIVYEANVTPSVVIDIIKNDKEQEEIKTTLADCLKMRIEFILENWKKSSELRLKFLQSNRNNLERVFQEWPMYTHNEGYVLISEDFGDYYPSVIDEIHQSWGTFFKNLKNIYRDELPDEYHLELVEKLDNKELSEDSKDALLLHLLPALLKPTGRPQLPIVTAQQDFLYYTVDSSRTGDNQKLPHIMIVTDCVVGHYAKESINEITVCCGPSRYICTSVKEALAVLYKSYWLFGIPYPRSINNVMMGIQKYFFNMSFLGETCSPTVNKIVKRLMSTEN